MKFSFIQTSAALALGISATLFSGCSGSQTPFYPAAPTAEAGASFTKIDAPDVSSAPGKLLYVASTTGCGFLHGKVCRAMVSLYSYPNGAYRGRWVDNANGNHAASHTGGACADRDGNVFVTYGGVSGKILEFAHGATAPTAIIRDPKGDPSACAADPMTGNLAVITTDRSGRTVLVIYRNGSGTLSGAYSDPNLTLSHVAYDDKGNAFVDGSGGLAELSRNGKSFEAVTLNRTVQSFGSLQWDGKNLAVTDVAGYAIDLFAIKVGDGGAIGGTLVDYTLLNDRSNGNQLKNAVFTQTWIDGNSVVAADRHTCVPEQQCAGAVNVWHYPQGGNPFRGIGGGADFEDPSGVAVSAR